MLHQRMRRQPKLRLAVVVDDSDDDDFVVAADHPVDVMTFAEELESQTEMDLVGT